MLKLDKLKRIILVKIAEPIKLILKYHSTITQINIKISLKFVKKSLLLAPKKNKLRDFFKYS